MSRPLWAEPLDWDSATERVIGDDEADELLKKVHYRSPWLMA